MPRYNESRRGGNFVYENLYQMLFVTGEGLDGTLGKLDSVERIEHLLEPPGVPLCLPVTHMQFWHENDHRHGFGSRVVEPQCVFLRCPRFTVHQIASGTPLHSFRLAGVTRIEKEQRHKANRQRQEHKKRKTWQQAEKQHENRRYKQDCLATEQLAKNVGAEIFRFSTDTGHHEASAYADEKRWNLRHQAVADGQ